MSELLKRLSARPLISAEICVASLFVNLLALAAPIFVIQVLNRYVAFGVDATLATLAVGALMAVALELCFRQVRLYLARGLVTGPDEELSRGVVEGLAGLTIKALDTVPPGMRRQLLQAAETVRSAYTAPALVGLIDLPFLLLFLAGVYLLSPLLGTIAAVFVGSVLFISLLMYWLMQRPVRESTRTRGVRDTVTSTLIDTPDTVRAFNAQGFLIASWLNHSRLLDKLSQKVMLSRGLQQGLSHAAQGALTVAIIGTGAVQVLAQNLEVGVLIGANILAARALAEATRFGGQVEGLARAAQAKRFIKEFAKLPLERQRGSALTQYRGGFAFEDMGFAHTGAVAPLYEGINLALDPGSILLLAGDNGSGKTTLCRLMAGLYPPNRGRMLADGMDLRQILPEWWRQQICYLPQEPDLLNATLAENLSSGLKDVEEQTLLRAADAAGLRRFIEESPEGFRTQITESGRTLSRGTRRRIALARALTRNGRLVIFDEPTEGMDAAGCQAVYAVLETMARDGRTIVVASQDQQIAAMAHYMLDLNRKPSPLIRALPGRRAAPTPTPPPPPAPPVANQGQKA